MVFYAAVMGLALLLFASIDAFTLDKIPSIFATTQDVEFWLQENWLIFQACKYVFL